VAVLGTTGDEPLAVATLRCIDDGCVVTIAAGIADALLESDHISYFLLVIPIVGVFFLPLVLAVASLSSLLNGDGFGLLQFRCPCRSDMAYP
jgi:hypothetical protein